MQRRGPCANPPQSKQENASTARAVFDLSREDPRSAHASARSSRWRDWIRAIRARAKRWRSAAECCERVACDWQPTREEVLGLLTCSPPTLQKKTEKWLAGTTV